MGVRTTAKIPYGSSQSFWRIGRANAAVFPLPVFAQPIQSLPAKIGGIHFCWISVGLFIPTAWHCFTSHLFKPKLENVHVSSLSSAILLSNFSSHRHMGKQACECSTRDARRHAREGARFSPPRYPFWHNQGSLSVRSIHLSLAIKEKQSIWSGYSSTRSKSKVFFYACGGRKTGKSREKNPRLRARRQPTMI